MQRIKRAYVETATGQIHYRWCTPVPHARLGDAPGRPVLLLHQISSSSRMFERLMPLLAANGFMPLAMDFPGFGQSDPPRSGYGIPEFAQAVGCFLDALALRDPIPVIGHHTGAKTAVRLAAAEPHRVERLVLAGLPYYEDAAARARRWLQKMVEPIIPRPDGGHLMHEWTRLQDLSPDTEPALIHRELVDTLVAHGYDTAYQATFPFDVSSDLPKIACPTLIVAGRNDTQPVSRQEAVSRRIPGARLAVIEDGGVFMIDEHAQAIADVILPFLSAHEVGRC